MVNASYSSGWGIPRAGLKLKRVLRLGILRVAKAARAAHPLVGCKGRANAGHRQNTRRPEGFRGEAVLPPERPYLRLLSNYSRLYFQNHVDNNKGV